MGNDSDNAEHEPGLNARSSSFHQLSHNEAAGANAVGDMNDLKIQEQQQQQQYPKVNSEESPKSDDSNSMDMYHVKTMQNQYDNRSLKVYKSTCSLPTIFCCIPPGIHHSAPRERHFTWDRFFNWLVGVDYIHRERIATSYFLKDYKQIIVRSILAIYSTIIIINSLISEWNQSYWFAYFTHLSYLGLFIYLWLANVLSIRYHLNPDKYRNQKTKWIDVVCTIAYSITFTYHLVVPIVYWALLSKAFNWSTSTDEERWLSVSVHGFDFLLVFLDFMLCNSIVYYWGQVVFMVFFLILYLIYSFLSPYFWAYTSYGYPYFFVDPTRGLNWVIIVGVTAFVILMWSLSFFLHYGRSKLAHLLGFSTKMRGSIDGTDGEHHHYELNEMV
ncbi:hypothetical protein MIR68_010781 [Amoeboaphelidium protococcarum]|nr:hypothetical protein MIR68_010781 [Amoeboaphelidium protococcarum]